MSTRTIKTPNSPQLDGKQLQSPSLVAVRLELLARGKRISSATGFIDISPSGPVLVTNRHVFTGRHQSTGKPLNEKFACLPDQISIWFREKTGLSLVQHSQFLFDDQHKPLWLEHPTFAGRADIACLHLSGRFDNIYFHPRSGFIDSIPIDAPPILRPTTPVAIVGFPFGKHTSGFPVWTSGTIASEPDFDYNDLPVLLVDARTRPGQSGSPVLYHSETGLVMTEQGTTHYAQPITYFLGVYSGRITPDSDIGTVWRTNVLDELLNNGIPSTASDPDGSTIEDDSA